MTSLGTLLGSSARTELLRTLYFLREPAGLRQAARLASVHPHSAERALTVLTEEKLATRRRTRTRTLFQINPKHPDYPILAAVFDGADQARRMQDHARRTARAHSLLPLFGEALALRGHARKARHGA